MKIIKDIKIPEKTESRRVRLKCDICGEKSSGAYDWAKNCYEVEETTIEWKTGYSYPEGNFFDVFECDICPKCFEEKVIPTFRKLWGVEFQVREVD